MFGDASLMPFELRISELRLLQIRRGTVEYFYSVQVRNGVGDSQKGR